MVEVTLGISAILFAGGLVAFGATFALLKDEGFHRRCTDLDLALRRVWPLGPLWTCIFLAILAGSLTAGLSLQDNWSDGPFTINLLSAITGFAAFVLLGSAVLRSVEERHERNTTFQQRQHLKLVLESRVRLVVELSSRLIPEITLADLDGLDLSERCSLIAERLTPIELTRPADQVSWRESLADKLVQDRSRPAAVVEADLRRVRWLIDQVEADVIPRLLTLQHDDEAVVQLDRLQLARFDMGDLSLVGDHGWAVYLVSAKLPVLASVLRSLAVITRTYSR